MCCLLRTNFFYYKLFKIYSKMKIKNLFLLAALGLMASATLTSCEDILGEWSRPAPAVVTPSAIAVTSITLDADATINVGETKTLTATVAPDNATDKTVSWSSEDETIATVADGVVTAVAAGTAIVTATANDGSGVKAQCTVTVKIPGLLAGVFSVSDTKKVQFSQGNLQFQASTKTWRFAEHQYDYVGDDTKGNVYVELTKSNNASISETYTGWIDLFGWGTSGHEFASGYGTAYQPWATSTTYTDYGPTGTSNGLYGSFAQGDWGTNMVPAGWRTLTGGSSGEWSYLFNTRTTGGTVFGTAQARYAHATINTDVDGGVNGIILFPDGVDIASTEVTTDGTVNGNSDWATKCTSAQWTALEAKGCVFLPAAGERGGSSVNSVGSYGRYWSSSPESAPEGYASHVNFFSDNLEAPTYHERPYGHSVRLVRDVAE